MGDTNQTRGQVSQVPATAGRIVHVYGLGKLPLEPLAGVVTRAWPGIPHVNVEVFGDAANAGFSRHELYSAKLYDPLTPEQRKVLQAADPNTAWAEWMPYQQGQAAKTEQVAEAANKAIDLLLRRVAGLEARLDARDTPASPPPASAAAPPRKRFDRQTQA